MSLCFTIPFHLNLTSLFYICLSVVYVLKALTFWVSSHLVSLFPQKNNLFIRLCFFSVHLLLSLSLSLSLSLTRSNHFLWWLQLFKIAFGLISVCLLSKLGRAWPADDSKWFHSWQTDLKCRPSVQSVWPDRTIFERFWQQIFLHLPWFWSNGQRAHLLLRRSEFETCEAYSFYLYDYLKKKERGRDGPIWPNYLAKLAQTFSNFMSHFDKCHFEVKTVVAILAQL